MAYTFLDNSLNTIGVLTNKGGQTNDYWGDSITHEIATSQDVLTSVSLSIDKPSVNIDTSGNQKTWNHVIQGLSFNIDGIGRQVNENDYLIYQEGTNGKYYLMAITQVDESAVQSGFHYKTVQGLNAAAYDLSRKTLRAKSFAQIPDGTQEKGTAQNILKYIFDGINWDVRTIGSFGAVDYDIAEGTTAQAVLLDIIGMFEAEVDAYVQLNNWGKGANVFNKNGSIKRIFDFSTSLGKYRGETVRYNKNMVSITKTGARDSMYTKLYVNGNNNITIANVNKGADFIVDDVANRKYNKLGAVSTPPTYLEGTITNSAIENPIALLAWGKKQLAILNHPRYNYQISATNDDKVQLGDTVIIQDTHASDPIYLKSKVISKSVSLADPASNSFIVGEFSPIVIGADNGLEDTNQIMQLVNQANQTAVNAQKQADENTKKIADTRTDLEKNIDDRISEAKSYSDGLTQKAVNQINDELATVKSESDNLSAKTDQMIADANSYTDKALSDAKANIATVASKSLGTYLVRLLPGTNIFKTTNSTTIQAQVWKAGQDITSTLDNASFSWKISKDGTDAISLTNNVKRVTAKTSDFNNTGTYIVNVVIPVTDTNGTTRNQTFSDSTTIAKIADGTNGNGISSTTITYATSASGTKAPTSGYTSTIPTVNKGQFLWQRTTTSYTNGTTKNSDVVTYFAKDGLNGVDGIDGGQGMIAQPSKPKSGLVDGFLWLDTSQTYPVYYIYDSSIRDFKIYQFNAKNINADQIKAKFVGTDRLSASQIIADDLHVKSANIDGKITASQITVSSTNGTQTSLANFNLDEFSSTVTKVNNLSVGGRNLLQGTGTASGDISGGNGVFVKGGFNGYNAFKTNHAFNGRYINLKSALGRTNAKAGDWYTISVYVKADKQINTGSINVYRVLGNRDAEYNDGHLNAIPMQDKPIGTQWQQYSWSFQINNISLQRQNTRVEYAYDTGDNWIYWAGWTLEKGTIATDWSPAPEDTDNKISTVSQTVEGISSIVSDPTTGLTKRVQTAEGTLTQITGVDIPKLQKATLWQHYSSLNFNDYTEQGSFFFNTTSAKTNGPTTSTSWIYLIVEQGTADNSRIKQTAWYDGVNGVKITYVRTLNSGTWSPWYANDNDSVVTISKTNGSIKQEITDRKTGDNNTLESSKEFTKRSITNYDEGIQSQFTQTANGILAQVESTNMVVNSEFDPLNGTWYRLSNGGATGSQLAEAWSATQSGGFTDWPAVNGSRVISYASATWYSTALVTASAGKIFSASIVAARAPAPTISTALDLRIGFWDSSRKLLTTASAGNIIYGTSYKGAQKYVVENKTAPANTHFVSIIIAHSSANAIDHITRPSLNIGDKASPYTPTYGTSSSSTILSLFKNNWSIGINDNIGKITSGIVGDNNSMSLISNNITLDGNTTVTGDFYAKGGNFKNLNASNFTTGTIDANKIKVINLDVSSLSGNIANFITGNINKLDASVIHGTTGYLDTVSAGRVINNQDHHLQLAAHGLYSEKTHRAQFELLSYDDPSIDDEMKGSLNYYSTPSAANTRGIRFKANQILAIDTYDNGAGSLYLSAYERGQVVISARNSRTNYKPIKASRFNVASERRLKSDIIDLDDGALDIVNKTKIHQYTKNDTSEIGVIADEAPKELLSDDDKSISLYDYTSVLYKAVQELSQQVKELQDERTNS